MSPDGAVKYVFNDAAAITVFAWGVLEFSEGYYWANELNNALDILEHSLEFLIKCWNPAEQNGISKNRIVAQIGEPLPTDDHQFWTRPEKHVTARVIFFIED